MNHGVASTRAVLDDGRLTDSHGRVIDFRNTIIIMTSNLGSSALGQDGDGNGAPPDLSTVMPSVKKYFQPEFINRIDEILLFNSLKQEHMLPIVDIQLRGLQTLLLEEKRITFTAHESARHWLALEGFEPLYGARPLKRVIQRAVLTPLAKEILSGNILDGASVELRKQAGHAELSFIVNNPPPEAARDVTLALPTPKSNAAVAHGVQALGKDADAE